MNNPYEKMYDARMDVYRWQPAVADGFTKQVRTAVVADRPCRYSPSGQVSAGAPTPSIRNSCRLFCGLNEDVKEGDQLLITLRTGKRIEADLGECHPYTYQWQCEVKRDDNA